MKKPFGASLKSSAAPIAMGIAFLTSPVQAQDTATPAAEDDAPQIVVTGSRIQRPNLQSTSPLASVGSEEIKLKGTSNTEEILNSLPQLVAEQGSNLSISSTGIATANLRNLGSTRTLVLINGRRLMPGDPTQLAADLNTVPSALIRRVDVVTGGASSVYGSDAVAGVVNFIMDTEFTGARLDVSNSFYWDNNNNTYMQGLIDDAFGAGTAPRGSFTDGVRRNVTVTLGSELADGKGHITAYAGYHTTSPITQDSRDYSYCALSVDGDGTPQYCGGSSTGFPTNYTARVGPGGANQTFSIDANGNRTPTNFYNYAAVSYQQRQNRRFTGGVFANYEINESFNPYLEFMMTDDQSNAQFGPSGVFAVPVQVPCAGAPGAYTSTNPLVPQGLLNIICPIAVNGVATVNVRRRNVEGGGRVNDFRHTAYRIVTGMKGQISDAWSYDVYGQFGKTLYQQVLQNYLSVSRSQEALTVIGTRANPRCSSGNAACVPYDVWNNNPSAASLAYVSANPIFNGTTQEEIISGSINGDLGASGVKLPWTDEGVGLVLGAEYRKETLVSQPDSLFSSGDVAGLSSSPAPYNVSFNVKEVFGEVLVPIATGKSFFHELSLNLSARHSEYSLQGPADAYKIGLIWAPVPDFSVRASYNRAVRAPNLIELYAPPNIGLWQGVDPCSGKTPALTAAQCARTGVTLAQYGNVENGTAGQNDSFTGGNLNLVPERSDTYSLGFVLQPSAFRGFSLTADWFVINVEKYIQPGFPAPYIITQCALGTGPVASDPNCAKITRSAGGDFQNGDGTSGVDQTNINGGAFRSSGIDVSSAYRTDIGSAGRLNFDFNGTYYIRNRFAPIAGTNESSYDCVGYFGAVCAQPLPNWRHTLRTTWDTPLTGFSASVNWRFNGSVKNDATSAELQKSQGLNPAFLDPRDLSIGAKSYFDLALSYVHNEHLSLRASMNNVFNVRPPILSTTAADAIYSNGNTYPGIYDPLGRLINLAATVKF